MLRPHYNVSNLDSSILGHSWRCPEVLWSTGSNEKGDIQCPWRVCCLLKKSSSRVWNQQKEAPGINEREKYPFKLPTIWGHWFDLQTNEGFFTKWWPFMSPKSWPTSTPTTTTPTPKPLPWSGPMADHLSSSNPKAPGPTTSTHTVHPPLQAPVREAPHRPHSTESQVRP